MVYTLCLVTKSPFSFFPAINVQKEMDLRNILYLELNPYRSYFSVELYDQLKPILAKHPEIEIYDVAKKGRPEWLPFVPVFFNANNTMRVGPDAILEEFAAIQVASSSSIIPQDTVKPTLQPEESKGNDDDKSEESDPDDDSWCKPMVVKNDNSNDDVAKRVEEMARIRAERDRDSERGGKKR